MKILWDPIWENRKEWKEIWKEWPWNHRKSSIIFQNFCQNPSGLAIRSAPHQFQIFASEKFLPFQSHFETLNRTLQTNFCIYELEKFVQTSIIIHYAIWYTLNALWSVCYFDRYIPRQDSRLEDPRSQDLKTKKRPRRLKTLLNIVSHLYERRIWSEVKTPPLIGRYTAEESEDEWDWRLESECPSGFFRAGIWIPSLS